MSIGIVDVGIGNIGSLKQALYGLGFDVELLRQASQVGACSHVLLPGVGAFSAAMEKLNGAALVPSLKSHVATGKPLMGICLGMQLLADIGEEGGENSGLGFVPGRVVAIDAKQGYRLPHVGWNEARQVAKHPVLKSIRNDVDFYFVHSYRFWPEQPQHVLAETEYGEVFPSIIGKGNVVGAQFHPEKSQSNGLRILENFCNWDGTC